ncbi:MAG: VWA domain-containing protein [Candidatus Hodarchaeales archaeon]
MILDFISTLRWLGLPISPDETIMAQKTFQILGVQEKEKIRLGLRAAIVKKHEDIHIFDIGFDSFFLQKQIRDSSIPKLESFERAQERFLERLDETQYQEIGQLLLQNNIDQALTSSIEIISSLSSSSSAQTIGNNLNTLQNTIQRAFNFAFGVRVPIRDLTPDQRIVLPDQTILMALNLQKYQLGLMEKYPEVYVKLDEERPSNLSDINSFLDEDLNYLSLSVTNVKEQLIEIGRILASREKRRRQRAKRGKLDFRRTFRKNLSNNGIPIDLIQRRKRIQDPDIIILNDVSGSTRWVADWFFVITFAARSAYRKIRIFEFDNTMVDVTSALDRKTINRALEERKENWKKTLRPRRIHSDYQSSLEDFFVLTKYFPVSRKTTVLILGDCRDYDGLWHATRPISAELLRKIVLHSKRVLVLNPEEKTRWNTGDSVVQYFQDIGVEIFHVATLNDLINTVFELKQN